MKPPDQRAFEADIEGGAYQIGMANGQWGRAEPALVPASLAWPLVIFWVAAAPRPNAPDRFYVKLDCAHYPSQAQTGNFWDPMTAGMLAGEKRPKGTGQVAMVFRTDWEGGKAFYHPYDRVAAASHGDWAARYPRRIWSNKHTIVDLLSELHDLLHSHEYTGV